MKKHIYLLAIAAMCTSFVTAQVDAKKASIDDDGRLHFESIQIDEHLISASRDANLLTGFPFGQPANPTFKNTRGVALDDVNNDGIDEIIFGADDILYCLDGTGSILWERTLTGINVLPPTVGDMNGDGNLEIAVNNAGLAALGAAGAVYLINGSDGSDVDGWPITYDNHWMINAPVMADVDGDGVMEIVTGERVNGSQGFIHVLNMAGEELSGWPIETTGNVAFTPSVGDINNDGIIDIVSGLSADGSLYAYNASGELLDGFPQIATDGKFSYQSVILADLTGDGNKEIIGSRHGTGAEYFSVKSDGTYLDGWPIASPGWTYSPPSVADTDGDGSFEIFMGNPNTDGSEPPLPIDVLFGFNADGSNVDNFPISKVGGNEGVITLADIDNNGVVDIIFTSNIFTLEDRKGFVHAYAMDGTGEIDGFPLRTPALSYMNSAILGDIDNDGNFDITTLSANSTFGQGVDSVFVAAFDLGYTYMPENIYFNAYKGSNVRDGVVESISTGLSKIDITELGVFPNPASDQITIVIPEITGANKINVIDIRGRKLISETITGSPGDMQIVDINSLNKGVYFVEIASGTKTFIGKLMVQ